MKKRLLSWILVICMVLGMMPASVFATEAAITVGEDVSIDLRLNDWYTIDLSEHFTAEGELSYEVSDDGENWTAVEGASYNYYPAGSGAQVCHFRALDAEGNVSDALTLNANVASTPSKVTVTFSVTDGVGGFYTCEQTDTIMVPVSMTVPYFDLALYGLEGYYYNNEENGTAMRSGVSTTTPVTTLTLLKGLGDVDGDGSVTKGDAALIVDHYNEVIELSAKELLRADINADGVVDTRDANLIYGWINQGRD